MVNESQTVANIVLEHSETAEVFQRHRIDFCCRGERSVEVAAHERGLEPGDLVGQLRRAIEDRQGAAGASAADRNMKELSTAALVDHIVGKHHAYLRKTLAFLVPLAKKVARVHGDHNPKLVELRDAVDELAETLLPHLDEEEEDLFPALRTTTGVATGDAARRLASMLEEHLAVATLLERIRDASEDFTIPDWACGSYRTLFGELQAVERDTFTHVHLENHVLKPRFEPA
ncbi:MAG: iron-sulfur cluster repair di-iron protein [Kofleriaceae bacterium]